MNSAMVGIMLAVSIFLGFLGLLAFLWWLKGGQFDDEKKMMQGVLFDGEEELREAALLQKRREEKLKKLNTKDSV